MEGGEGEEGLGTRRKNSVGRSLFFSLFHFVLFRFVSRRNSEQNNGRGKQNLVEEQEQEGENAKELKGPRPKFKFKDILIPIDADINSSTDIFTDIDTVSI